MTNRGRAMLYFAYGSNMSQRRLQARAPTARVKTRATLRRHKLAFHKQSVDGSGKCDIHETGQSSDFVVGVVFEIDSIDKPTLDQYEGLGHGYDEKDVELTTPEGEAIAAYSYHATLIDSKLKPYHWYKHHVLAGARENKLPESYIASIEKVESIPDPKSERHQKELSIYEEASPVIKRRPQSSTE